MILVGLSFLLASTFAYCVIHIIKNLLLYKPNEGNQNEHDKFVSKIIKLTGQPEQRYQIRTPDHFMLDLIYVQNMKSDKCIIFCHGNSGNITGKYRVIKFLYTHSNASIIAFDYRGYGRSSGTRWDLSCNALRTDAMTVVNFVETSLLIPRHNISLVGQSLGCAVAIACAAQVKNIHSLICISPFYSLPSIICDMFKQFNLGFLGWLVSLFVDSDYRSDRLIKSIRDTKILIAHSKKDELIPYKQAEDLAYLSLFANFTTIAGPHKHPEFNEQFISILATTFS